MAICQELWFAEHRSEMGYKVAATGRRPRALEGELTCKIFACPWIFPELRINQKNTGTLESFFWGRCPGLSPSGGLHVQRFVSILGRFNTILIEPTRVVEQVDNEVQPILLELSSSIKNSRDFTCGC